MQIVFENPESRMAAEVSVFRRELDDSEYVGLSGDVGEDALVSVAFDEPWSKVDGLCAIRIHAKSKLGSTVVRLVPGRFEFANCEVKEPKKGAGARILHRLATVAQHYGFQEITATGEQLRDPKTGKLKSVGHYAFARLGFDADIPAETPPRPLALAEFTRVSELVASEDGREFWLESGVTVPHMTFDLAHGSKSWETLAARLG